ncbi:hypothetical protein K456DRAFT_1732010 [Colletotrichum gloeosporioides 23]|nr:hypothetical protein K456DRAFT_1732010 [Colletotrichum gloeosporioides 23]
MASQPPAGSGPLLASSANPDRGSGSPPEPPSTSRAKRRRATPLTAKGLLNVTGIATGAVLKALNEEVKHYED